MAVDKIMFKLAQGFNRIFDDLQGMYVFGASVDGEIHEDEDIEVVALFKIDDQSKRGQIWPVVGKVETDCNVSIDLYPYTEESFKKDEDIYEQVMKEGIFYNSKGIKE